METIKEKVINSFSEEWDYFSEHFCKEPKYIYCLFHDTDASITVKMQNMGDYVKFEAVTSEPQNGKVM